MTNNIGSTWSLRSGRSTATTYDWRCEIIQSNKFNSVFHIQHVVTCLFNILYRLNNIWAWFICCTCFCSFILTMSQFFCLKCQCNKQVEQKTACSQHVIVVNPHIWIDSFAPVWCFTGKILLIFKCWLIKYLGLWKSIYSVIMTKHQT